MVFLNEVLIVDGVGHLVNFLFRHNRCSRLFSFISVRILFMKTTLCALGVALTLILNSYSETFKLWPEGEGGSGAENVTLTLHRAKQKQRKQKLQLLLFVQEVDMARV